MLKTPQLFPQFAHLHRIPHRRNDTFVAAVLICAYPIERFLSRPRASVIAPKRIHLCLSMTRRGRTQTPTSGLN